ncbi:MAG: vitamin B12-dependent ribonucleotide reductase [Candidatus Woesearchaeota archaeon]|nr:vitamin B12-dependent ribonucleotide reductase [Candidatus Woesearchaeota archaeon]
MAAKVQSETFSQSSQSISSSSLSSVDSSASSLRFLRRFFSTPGINPLDEQTYVKRTSLIKEPTGKVVFEMADCEVPSTWSQLATDIAASKYFRKAGVPGTGSESSARQLVFRIANTLREAGEVHGYFATKEEADTFEAELTNLLITQKGAFNSPVWFNCGLHKYGITSSGGNWYYDEQLHQVKMTEDAYSRPQCSACFIQPVEDDLMSMFDLLKAEARLFKFGSGTGSNFSKIRSKYEKLSGGGTSSGLMSFLKVFDTGAGATKSGGTTRRAAKMVCLDMDHPEIEDFILWKVREEKKVHALIAAGYPADFNGEAYQTVSGQNSNNSVRLTDDFMNSMLNNGSWATTSRTTGKIYKEYKARDLMKMVCEAAWVCADPGVQFDTIINDWHTCPNSDKIYASNPCSEYMFLDNTACNLASINLMKFASDDGNLIDIETFEHACKIFITAQEIIVSMSSYPTKAIAERSHQYRTLGLGYANLGTLLMVNGIPYDSDKARAISGAITAIMCGTGYEASAHLSGLLGPFDGYASNREPMLRVINKHREEAYKIDVRYCPENLLNAARESWDAAVTLGEKYGFRNAQVTVIAPTGTIGLLMDCDTTGVEPEFSLVKWKKLAGGGYFKIINNSIITALKKLGYDALQIDDIKSYIVGRGTLEGAPHINPSALVARGFTAPQIKEAADYIAQMKSLDDWTPNINIPELKKRGFTTQHINEAMIYVSGAQTVEGAPHLKPEHVAVFDCANKCGSGTRFIAPMGHVKMMAAVQPFISGAISKTVNIPNEASVEDIEKIYIEAWKLGLKAIALYRDGCKQSQPLTAQKTEKDEVKKSVAAALRTLPKRRRGLTVESSVAGQNLKILTSEFDDGSLAEFFVEMHKEGSTLRSLINCVAKAVNIGLQHNIPMDKYVDELTFMRFEPAGMTDHPNIKTSTSIIDFVMRVLALEYLGRTDLAHVKPAEKEQKPEVHSSTSGVPQPTTDGALSKQMSTLMGDAPACNTCGHITVRSGTCYKCLSCGNSMGCS